MRELVYTLILFLAALHVQAQERPLLDVNYAEIKTFVEQETDSCARLMERYWANDTTLTRRDYAVVYFGHAFTPAYNGGYIPFTELEKLMRDDARLDEAVALCRKELERYPVSLTLLNYMAVLLARQDKKDEGMGYLYKFFSLLDMIAHTGEGYSEASPFKVICVNDEYRLMRDYWRLGKPKSQALVDNCDVMEVVPNHRYLMEKMYFDISLPFTALRKMMSERK